jgi:hypothetical protein
MRLSRWLTPKSRSLRFEDFVTTPPLHGLGADLRTLQNLCRDDAEALGELEKVTQRQHGGDRKSDEIKIDNVQLDPTPTGNSRTAALRRRRKAREDLHELVLADDVVQLRPTKT